MNHQGTIHNKIRVPLCFVHLDVGFFACRVQNGDMTFAVLNKGQTYSAKSSALSACTAGADSDNTLDQSSPVSSLLLKAMKDLFSFLNSRICLFFTVVKSATSSGLKCLPPILHSRNVLHLAPAHM